MEIGDSVTYIRQNKDGICEGAAVLRGIGLDGENRLIALLKEGENSFNAYMACLNPTAEFCDEFKKMVDEIEVLAKEENTKAQTIISIANDQVNVIRNKLLGEPVK